MKRYTAIYPSPLGPIRFQCSDDYVHSVEFHTPSDVTPPVEHPLLQQCFSQMDAYFAGSLTMFQLPLQQEATAFQQKVWELLAQIPYGTTLSYQQLAVRYGDTKAIRAVASANGKNKLAIIVPCHRVIGTNHSLTGYAGGLWRKRWLLEHEVKHSGGAQQIGLPF